MNSKTASVSLQASESDVFSYLSKEENLIHWATEFCKELKKDENGRWKVGSPMGEMFFKIKSDENNGIIDMYYGPTEDKMSVLNTKVLKNSAKNNSTEFTCTCHQESALSNEVFDQQFESLKRELENLKTKF